MKRKIIGLILLVALVFPTFSWAADKEIKIRPGDAFLMFRAGGNNIYLKVTILKHPGNHLLVVVCDSEDGDYHSSDIPLDGDKTPSVFTVGFHLSPAKYFVTGTLIRSDGSTFEDRTEFTIVTN